MLVWIIYRTPIYVSKQQVAVFRNLQACEKDEKKKIVNNYRAIQKPNENPDIRFVRNVNQKLRSKL